MRSRRYRTEVAQCVTPRTQEARCCCSLQASGVSWPGLVATDSMAMGPRKENLRAFSLPLAGYRLHSSPASPLGAARPPRRLLQDSGFDVSRASRESAAAIVKKFASDAFSPDGAAKTAVISLSGTGPRTAGPPATARDSACRFPYRLRPDSSVSVAAVPAGVADDQARSLRLRPPRRVHASADSRTNRVHLTPFSSY